ncbi:MAG: glycosyltransferase family protein [Myxococcota bacterium]
MATIIYGLAGEGRGQAMRAKTVIEHLRAQNHRVIIYTFGQALEVLEPLYAGTEVEVNAIPGLRWGYLNGKVSFFKTTFQALPLLAQIPFWAHRISKRMKQERADLILSDFEPITIHAAKLAGIPLWSLDHQRFLVHCDLGKLPTFEAFRVWCMRTAIRIVHGSPDRMLISGFYLPELKKPNPHIERVGILMRPAVLAAKPTRGEHLLAYMRRDCPDAFLEMLATCGREVRLYGLGERPPRGGIVFKATDPYTFIDDLASSYGLICTAGNQLIGEAMYMSKAVLALPEASNSEQQMNAHLLRMSGAGMVVDFASVNAEDIARFIDGAEMMSRRVDPESVSANQRVLGLIDQQLATTTRAVPVSSKADVKLQAIS